MKKKIILRGLLGFPLGITIGYIITILISLRWANGYYAPCVPELTAMTGREIYAVILQTLLCGVLGAGFGAGSVIWEIENWSLIRQTGVYFGITSVLMMPIAYILYWMEHSIAGVACYFGIFFLIFAGIWTIQLIAGRHTVKKMNAGLKKSRNGKTN